MRLIINYNDEKATGCCEDIRISARVYARSGIINYLRVSIIVVKTQRFHSNGAPFIRIKIPPHTGPKLLSRPRRVNINRGNREGSRRRSPLPRLPPRDRSRRADRGAAV